ncbi:MAG: hypothetical protein HOL08_01240 [Opitutae bacterium]|nr:hypothetical protein [Opitutae bacterium]
MKDILPIICSLLILRHRWDAPRIMGTLKDKNVKDGANIANPPDPGERGNTLLRRAVIQ